MGKELAMVERNAKGKQVLRYFIECKRRTRDSAWISPKIAQLQEELITAQRAHIAALERGASKAAEKPRRRHFRAEGWHSSATVDMERAMRLLTEAIAANPSGKSGVAKRLGVSTSLIIRIFRPDDPRKLSRQLAWHILNVYE